MLLVQVDPSTALLSTSFLLKFFPAKDENKLTYGRIQDQKPLAAIS